MAIGAFTNQFSILTTANSQLLSADSSVSTGTATYKIEVTKLPCPIAGSETFDISDFGFVVGAQLAIYNSGDYTVTYTDTYDGMYAVIPAGGLCFLPFLDYRTVFSFNGVGGTGAVDILALGT